MSGKEHKNVSLEVLNDLNTQITVLWEVTPCNFVDCAFEMSWTTHPNDIASRHIPDQHCWENIMNLYHTENVKCYNNNEDRKLKDENNQKYNMSSPYTTILFL